MEKLESISLRPLTTEEKLISRMWEAHHKAVDSLARYKFLMFGYWAAQWVTLNQVRKQLNPQAKQEPNPFKGFVKLARMTRDAKVTSDAWEIGSKSNFTIKGDW